MSNSTARNYWLKRFDFKGEDVRCVARRCGVLATFRIGWRFDRKLNGHPVETTAYRPACEKHARLFAFKHDLKVPRSAT